LQASDWQSLAAAGNGKRLIDNGIIDGIWQIQSRKGARNQDVELLVDE
jgi:hypothetical protein